MYSPSLQDQAFAKGLSENIRDAYLRSVAAVPPEQRAAYRDNVETLKQTYNYRSYPRLDDMQEAVFLATEKYPEQRDAILDAKNIAFAARDEIKGRDAKYWFLRNAAAIPRNQRDAYRNEILNSTILRRDGATQEAAFDAIAEFPEKRGSILDEKNLDFAARGEIKGLEAKIAFLRSAAEVSSEPNQQAGYRNEILNSTILRRDGATQEAAFDAIAEFPEKRGSILDEKNLDVAARDEIKGPDSKFLILRSVATLPPEQQAASPYVLKTPAQNASQQSLLSGYRAHKALRISCFSRDVFTKDPNDYTKVITQYEKALRAPIPEGREKGSMLRKLGDAYYIRAVLAKDPKDYSPAINALKEVLNPPLWISLSNEEKARTQGLLGEAYLGRGDRTNKLEDYTSAIDAFSAALNLPLSEKEKAITQGLLGEAYLGCGLRTNNSEYYTFAINAFDAALKLPLLLSDKETGTTQSFLGEAHLRRGALTNNSRDYKRAIIALSIALNQPLLNETKTATQSFFGEAHLRRGARDNNSEAYTSAIDAFKSVLEQQKSDEKGITQSLLGEAYLGRGTLNNDSKDFINAINACNAALSLPLDQDRVSRTQQNREFAFMPIELIRARRKRSTHKIGERTENLQEQLSHSQPQDHEPRKAPASIENSTSQQSFEQTPIKIDPDELYRPDAPAAFEARAIQGVTSLSDRTISPSALSGTISPASDATGKTVTLRRATENNYISIEASLQNENIEDSTRKNLIVQKTIERFFKDNLGMRNYLLQTTLGNDPARDSGELKVGKTPSPVLSEPYRNPLKRENVEGQTGWKRVFNDTKGRIAGDGTKPLIKESHERCYGAWRAGPRDKYFFHNLIEKTILQSIGPDGEQARKAYDALKALNTLYEGTDPNKFRAILVRVGKAGMDTEGHEVPYTKSRVWSGKDMRLIIECNILNHETSFGALAVKADVSEFCALLVAAEKFVTTQPRENRTAGLDAAWEVKSPEHEAAYRDIEQPFVSRQVISPRFEALAKVSPDPDAFLQTRKAIGNEHDDVLMLLKNQHGDHIVNQPQYIIPRKVPTDLIRKPPELPARKFPPISIVSLDYPKKEFVHAGRAHNYAVPSDDPSAAPWKITTTVTVTKPTQGKEVSLGDPSSQPGTIALDDHYVWQKVGPEGEYRGYARNAVERHLGWQKAGDNNPECTTHEKASAIGKGILETYDGKNKEISLVDGVFSIDDPRVQIVIGSGEPSRTRPPSPRVKKGEPFDPRDRELDEQDVVIWQQREALARERGRAQTEKQKRWDFKDDVRTKLNQTVDMSDGEQDYIDTKSATKGAKHDKAAPLTRTQPIRSLDREKAVIASAVQRVKAEKALLGLGSTSKKTGKEKANALGGQGRP
jgi:hypothetical protein